MSFILDALKKSESDRQRQGGPALFEVKVAPRRSALPAWAIAIAVLFAANLGVVLWLLLRHGAAPAEMVQPPAGSLALRAPPTSPAAAPAPAPVPASVPAPAAASAPPSALPAATPVVTASDRRAPPAAPEPAANPDDYAPAAEAPAPGTGHVQRGTSAGVPLYQQLAATPGNQLPQLRLDLLAYADKTQDRWVLINMHKLREGDSLPEGVQVERIAPDGVVLSWHSTQFLLTRD
ncbi:MAG: general secretion pathway protein GspB [Steroidobacteraceae bacterium]